MDVGVGSGAFRRQEGVAGRVITVAKRGFGIILVLCNGMF